MYVRAWAKSINYWLLAHNFLVQVIISTYTQQPESTVVTCILDMDHPFIECDV